MSIPEFLVMNIKKDIQYIIGCIETDKILDLVDQFNVFILDKDIQKLLLLEEVL